MSRGSTSAASLTRVNSQPTFAGTATWNWSSSLEGEVNVSEVCSAWLGCRCFVAPLRLPRFLPSMTWLRISLRVFGSAFFTSVETMNGLNAAAHADVSA